MNLECLSCQFACHIIWDWNFCQDNENALSTPYPSPYHGSAIFVIPLKLNYKPNLDQSFPKIVIRLKSGCTPLLVYFFSNECYHFFCLLLGFFVCFGVFFFFWFMEPMKNVALRCSSLWAPAGIIIETSELQGTSHYYWTKIENILSDINLI